MVVIGSANSSNTLALARTAVAAGCPRVLRVNTAAELPDDLAGVVGVIAGASAPESLVEEVLVRLAPAKGTEEVRAVPEDEYFPLPRELREVLRSVAGLLATAAFAPGEAAGGTPVETARPRRPATCRRPKSSPRWAEAKSSPHWPGKRGKKGAWVSRRQHLDARATRALEPFSEGRRWVRQAKPTLTEPSTSSSRLVSTTSTSLPATARPRN